MDGNEVEIYFENGRRAYCLDNPNAFAEMEARFGCKIARTLRQGGRTIAQTPSPKKDRVYGSETNKPGSSKDLSNASEINFDEKTLKSIKNKVKNFNLKNPDKKITLSSAKAVVRRGMGAYSKSHRPTIKGGKPNSRTAWGLARLNAFMYKIEHGKSKSGKYSQDDDLIKELGYKVSKMELGGSTNKPTETELAERWDKKKSQIATLTDNIQRLRYNLTRNLNGATENNTSSSQKIFLTSLVLCLMDETGERVGNEESASNGHFGITGLKKKHIKIDGNRVTLKYVGKSGVEHEVTFTNEKIANALKRAISNSMSDFVFETSEGFKIKADRVNRFLTDYNVTAKDLRGYSANKWVVEKLNKLDAGKDEKERKKQFNEIVKKVANEIGHGRATLKNHYLLPELEPNFVERGKIIKLNEN